jgi:hypothetical protein
VLDLLRDHGDRHAGAARRSGVAGILAWRRHWLAFWGWAAAFGGGSILDWMLKLVVHRPRPPYAEA